MTIYHLELTLANLCRIDSAVAIHDLCVLLWAKTLQHFHRDIFTGEAEKRKITTYNRMIQWYLEIILRTTLHNTEHAVTSIVMGDIYVERPRDQADPAIKQAFTLDTIDEVEPEVLVALLHRVLDLTLQALIPNALTMSQIQVKEWADRAMDISKDLAVLMEMTPLKEEDPEGDNFISIMINFKIHDHQNRVRDYL